MRVLALVTARGGSKGFPGKNLARLAGRPLVCWAYRALDLFRQNCLAHDIILHLSTDAQTIADAWPIDARPTHLRPAELASDSATSHAVIDYELQRFAALGLPCDAVILLQPTSPLITHDDIMRVWQPIADGTALSSIAVVKAAHPLAWARHIDADGHLIPAVAQANSAQRQNQTPAYFPTGLYAARSSFLQQHQRFDVAEKTCAVEIAHEHAVDIDYPHDLAVAAALLQQHKRNDHFYLGQRLIGGDAPCFVIAEAGVNHNGDPQRALALVHAAADAGADAVKFQTFRAKDLVGASARKAAYQTANTGSDESQLAMLERLELGPEVFRHLKAEAEKRGLIFLSTPFDQASAELLSSLGVVGFKLGSGDLTNLPFLTSIAHFGKPIILSSGMANLDEVEDAVHTLNAAGCQQVAMLHCVSSYPAPINDSNLRAMDSIRLALGVTVGMSDHSMGWEVTLAAVARGAKIIEKHVTLDRRLPGPDHAASIEPHELKIMIQQIRLIESALGDGIKIPAACERDTAEVARRSVVAARDITPGTALTTADLAIKRPGTGIQPRHYNGLLGRTLKRGLVANEPLQWHDVL
jgi:N,N'-diacetyllegionaminate synthase